MRKPWGPFCFCRSSWLARRALRRPRRRRRSQSRRIGRRKPGLVGRRAWPEAGWPRNGLVARGAKLDELKDRVQLETVGGASLGLVKLVEEADADDLDDGFGMPGAEGVGHSTGRGEVGIVAGLHRAVGVGNLRHHVGFRIGRIAEEKMDILIQSRVDLDENCLHAVDVELIGVATPAVEPGRQRERCEIADLRLDGSPPDGLGFLVGDSLDAPTVEPAGNVSLFERLVDRPARSEEDEKARHGREPPADR